MTTIEAAYEGAGCVRIAGRLFDYRFRGKDPSKSKGDGYGGVMPQAARQLIAEGADPETIVRVTRDGTRVFSEDLALGAWAALRFEEPSEARHSVRARRYRPLDGDRLGQIRQGAMLRGFQAHEAASHIGHHPQG